MFRCLKEGVEKEEEEESKHIECKCINVQLTVSISLFVTLVYFNRLSEMKKKEIIYR